MRTCCHAQPQPGDVFRDYRWFNAAGDAGQALRVGTRGIGPDYATAPVVPEWNVDLEHAVRAEIVLEKILCHDGTQGLALSVNGHDWIPVPDPPGIPDPCHAYQHHTYPTVPLPLEQLLPGAGNAVRLRVAPEHPWNWPQVLVNGVHLRVFYEAARKPHPTGRLTGVEPGGKVGPAAMIGCQADSPNGAIVTVDWFCLCTDVNFEGDGVYRQWHGHYDHGRPVHHVGHAGAAPFEVVWDTAWLPDQPEPMAMTARVTDTSGITTVLSAVGGLSLDRPGRSVELCALRDVPPRWVTRRGPLAETFTVQGDPSQAVAVQLAWCSWSPGYMNGVSINGVEVFGCEGPRYRAFWHRVTLADCSMLRHGDNTLATGMTPLHDGKMVHGMEVNWPGIMVLVQYRH